MSTKRVVEYGPSQRGEMVENLAAPGAEGIGLVEDRSDAALLRKRWEWNQKLCKQVRAEPRQVRP